MEQNNNSLFYDFFDKEKAYDLTLKSDLMIYIGKVIQVRKCSIKDASNKLITSRNSIKNILDGEISNLKTGEIFDIASHANTFSPVYDKSA
ncbi:MAG: hypothetical protein QM571_00105 [Micrococcaceae bacterium]